MSNDATPPNKFQEEVPRPEDLYHCSAGSEGPGLKMIRVLPFLYGGKYEIS